METVFRLKQMILKVSTIVGKSFGLEMASYNMDQQSYRTNTDAGRPLVMNNSNQLYPQLPPPLGFSVPNHCLPPPGQVAPPQRQMNDDYELNGSLQVTLQRVVSQYNRRRRHERCYSLQRNVCWVVGNVVLTCALVLGLLFLLKYVNSPLLRPEGHSNNNNNAMTETIFVQGSGGQKGCRPCPGNHGQNDDQTSSSNCCTLSHEMLQKLIEQMTKEALSKQLLQTDSKQSGHVPKTSTGQEACGALFFLDKDENKTAARQSGDGYTVLRGWNTDGNVAFNLTCIKHNSSTGEVTITQSGYYVVYSHLAFIWTKPTDSGSTVVLGQKIRLQYPNGVQTKEAIATDTQAIQLNDPGVPSTPSYNSQTLTIVHLRSETRLTVQARRPDLVLRSTDASSFGLYRLQ